MVSVCAPIRPSDAVAETIIVHEKTRWLNGLVKKAKHPKVRSGCLTCKQRRLKCDEGKPSCARCGKSGRICAGYEQLFARSSTQLRISYAEPDSFASEEDKLLQHFLVEATQELSGFSLSLKQFCGSLVPQMAFHPAVRFALLTIAAKTQAAALRWDKRRRRSEALECKSSALLYYNQSISNLTQKDLSEIPPAVYLVCGLLFGASELWPHIDMRPTIHVLTAFQIVLRCAATLSEEVQRSMYPFLIHMGRKTLAYADDIPPDLAPAIARFCWVHIEPAAVADTFSSTEQAWATMEDLHNFTCTLIRPDVAFDNDADTNARDYARSVEQSLLNTLQTVGEEEAIQYRAMLMHHRTSRTMLDARLGSDEGIYDIFVPDFEYILFECESLMRAGTHPPTPGKGPWRCELGTLAPLFFVATRCRVASLRHRAIKALHTSKHREKEWNSCIAFMLARLVVQTEEKHRQPSLGGNIPVEHRIQLDSVTFNRSEEQIVATYLNPTTNEYGTKTLSWKARDAIDDDFECVSLSRQRLQASGYSGILLCRPSIQCQCGGEPGNER
ncbi:uncharacterized protein AB675_5919 [Cyphellophora attinorum]|uniref:Zn(2)-C6 fungal-type domain-containing protein n=1 Tax=Cyphellophora attinorum TaxID=1664694 RepID=A0A0N1NZS2_9EURO|nr:uncharacterized protein AB675_5919 [Phialophora attinorum]KPI38825.1 hypothetical protein AB675_5919 [Phialophora attinorum]